jgi:hypothetical protein
LEKPPSGRRRVVTFFPPSATPGAIAVTLPILSPGSTPEVHSISKCGRVGFQWYGKGYYPQ